MVGNRRLNQVVDLPPIINLEDQLSLQTFQKPIVFRILFLVLTPLSINILSFQNSL